MLNTSSRKKDVEVDGDYFKLKRAYPVWDKESLRKFMLKSGKMGVADAEELWLCYRGVQEDVE